MKLRKAFDWHSRFTGALTTTSPAFPSKGPSLLSTSTNLTNALFLIHPLHDLRITWLNTGRHSSVQYCRRPLLYVLICYPFVPLARPLFHTQVSTLQVPSILFRAPPQLATIAHEELILPSRQHSKYSSSSCYLGACHLCPDLSSPLVILNNHR